MILVAERNSLLISTYSKEGPVSRSGGGAPTSAAWPAAQRAIYAPLTIPMAGRVYRLFWMNGATVGTDTVQVGLYLPDGTDGGPGTRVLAGSAVTSSGANAPQYDDIADVDLAAGDYWLGVWASGTTTTLFRTNAPRAWGQYAESSLAGGLPATATPVQPPLNYLPLAGLVMRSTP